MPSGINELMEKILSCFNKCVKKMESNICFLCTYVCCLLTIMAFTGFLTVMKGLPSTFNKDLQEDKEPLFDTYNTLTNILQIACGTLETLKINKESCFSALSPEMLATDVAYYLVNKGMPFRNSHKVAGEVVAMAEKEKCSISNLTLSQLKQISEHFEDDVSNLWNYEHSVEQYQSFGGTARVNIEIQIQQLELWITDSQILTTQV